MSENIYLLVAETGGSGFTPRILLYGPSSEYISYHQNYTIAHIGHTVSQNGTYTVVLVDWSGGHTGSGTYDLYFTRIPRANDGGTLISRRANKS